MYWIASRLAAGFEISAAIATIMAAGMAALSQTAQAQPAPPPPLIIPKVELSEEETPPAPKARPVEKVEVTPPALLQLQQKLRDHPGQRRAGRDCAGHDGDGRYYRPEAHCAELYYDAA